MTTQLMQDVRKFLPDNQYKIYNDASRANNKGRSLRVVDFSTHDEYIPLLKHLQELGYVCKMTSAIGTVNGDSWSVLSHGGTPNLGRRWRMHVITTWRMV